MEWLFMTPASRGSWSHWYQCRRSTYFCLYWFVQLLYLLLVSYIDPLSPSWHATLLPLIRAHCDRWVRCRIILKAVLCYSEDWIFNLVQIEKLDAWAAVHTMHSFSIFPLPSLCCLLMHPMPLITWTVICNHCYQQTEPISMSLSTVCCCWITHWLNCLVEAIFHLGTWLWLFCKCF